MGCSIIEERKLKYQRIALLFPGQGAQYPGMGKDFAEQFSSAREVYQEADELLKRNLSTIVWNGPEELLTETKNSQTGIFVTSLALYRVLKQHLPGLKPVCCAGLSLGEYSALAASGKLTYEDGIRLVEKRGQFMNDACISHPGTMAVVMGLDATQVEMMVAELDLPNDLWVANLNCPGQVVISGTLKGVELGSARAKEKGAKRVVPLQVFGAFHSGLMDSASKKLTPEILSTPFAKTDVKIAMNVTGNFVEEADEIRSYLIAQVTSPVRWEQDVRAMDRDGVDLFLEIGCGKTLSGMNKRIGIQVPTLTLEKVADLEPLLKELT